MQHQLSFECDREDGGFSIYLLLGPEDAVGNIQPTPNGRWAGNLWLEGRYASGTYNDRQDVVDTFQFLAATGMPSQSKLNAQCLAEARDWIRKAGGPRRRRKSR